MTGLQEITFDNHELSEHGCVILEPPKRPFPKRKYEKKTVYGRSGDLIIDSESYENFSLTYKVATIPDLHENIYIDEVLTELKAWLCSSVDYKKLYDTELPDGFYYAFCSGISDAVCVFDDMYEFEITFDCKPYFYYDSGQQVITVNDRNISLYNIGKSAAKPIIEIYGRGTLSCYINGQHFTINNVINSVKVDCEKLTAYSSGTNMADDFDGIYLNLAVGNNSVSFTGENYSSAKITPRWCRL